MGEITQTVVGAGGTILEYGAIGAMLVISLLANGAQWWFARNDRKRYTDHLESHTCEVIK